MMQFYHLWVADNLLHLPYLVLGQGTTCAGETQNDRHAHIISRENERVNELVPRDSLRRNKMGRLDTNAAID
jgi:hypothetical protein